MAANIFLLSGLGGQQGVGVKQNLNMVLRKTQIMGFWKIYISLQIFKKK